MLKPPAAGRLECLGVVYTVHLEGVPSKSKGLLVSKTGSLSCRIEVMIWQNNAVNPGKEAAARPTLPG